MNEARKMAKAIIIGCALCGALLILLFRHGVPRRSEPNGNESYALIEATTTESSVPLTYSHISGDEYAAIEHDVNSSRNHILLLHRKKRYLLFPEGSSFQLVFDLIIPIVDYTNFAILGVTCAVAWELPSKPPSELLHDLRTRLDDGTLGTVRRNDSVEPEQLQQPQLQQQSETVPPLDNGDYIGTATNWQSMHAQPAPTAAEASTSTYATNAHRYSAYYTNVQSNGGGGTSAYANSANGEQPARRPANWHARQSIAKWRQWAGTSPPAVPTTIPSVDWSDNWWQRNKVRVQQNWRQKQQQWSSYAQTTQRSFSSWTERPRQLLQEPPRHIIYPVFGKRRRRRHVDLQEINDDAIERLHLRQHLISRGLLFGKIERLYKTRQLNGTSCIQRALCESAQRQEHGHNPQSFIMELLSAIFQLPSGLEGIEADKHIPSMYLEAHRAVGDCQQLFGDCNHKFWFE
ncbi:uncharacterized protein LOC133838989 [Drosophila sulfurigaster albostrigata]|uniref:uncharacterized protein LOC133838989 n=1 Tax=Drosophila sulfurigaster albostrigata TaxID=89887 RepID=UPI002D21B96C|nr:uncharacterized protein LOC133838989 [Drosophila sulfurigaster albostrigata]XP_062126253.1 uncharacterized protein LOC133838989 [Drosophila sulfurigaster albostrigata]XP_062126254.1 uncharacterized protein LOC133838989 [Drosophila sulfurigaster albostrigata]